MSDNTQDENPTVAEVSVTGPGVSITRSVDEGAMNDIVALMFGAAPTAGRRGRKGEVDGVRDEPQWDDDLTLGEFIVESESKTFPQKICAAGYYLTKIGGAEFFTMDEARVALAEAHDDMPSNFSRDFNNAASKNYIAHKQGADASHFVVPRSGRTAVETKFTDLPKTRARKASKKAATSNGGAE